MEVTVQGFNSLREWWSWCRWLSGLPGGEGYGLVQLARRQRNAGTTASGVRKILLKRNGWLVAFGLAHATLLYFGDFLGA